MRDPLRNDRLRRAVCWLIYRYIRLVYRTNRWYSEGGERPLALRHAGRPFILAFWHGRLLMIPMAWQGLAPMHMLISAHRDGRIIADAVRHFGIGSIAGSTRRGGPAALRAMLKWLGEGDCVGITPDGARGPAMTASTGIVNAARLAQVPILPVTCAMSRHIVLRSWDRFHLALPFGRGVFLWGEPIEIPRDLDEPGIEGARRLVENRLDELTREADRRAMSRRGQGLAWFYRVLSRCLAPLVRAYLRRRVGRGKEDAARLPERRGIAELPRPPGPLIWIHAASIGEATAVLKLIGRLLAERPQLEILVTSGTVTSARLLAERLPPGARHQYAPVDLPAAVARFLDHWRPDLALWVESELWPNLVSATALRGIPMLLLNGRLSARSFARWRRWPGFIGALLGSFALCLTQDSEQASRFSALGARKVVPVGDLKAAAAPLPFEPAALAALRRDIGARPLWLAASTHAGEEEIAAAAHERLAPRFPGLLTIIAPRHPQRGREIARMLASRGLRIARRAAGESVAADTAIYLADTLGELGLLYRLAGIAFIGGSLVGKGGHNPFEAARLGCAVLLGPDTRNCAQMATALAASGASETVRDAGELADRVAALLAEPQLLQARAAAGTGTAAEGEAILDEVLRHLEPWIEALACGGALVPRAARRRA